jgi:hypothetical protein
MKISFPLGFRVKLIFNLLKWACFWNSTIWFNK